MIQLATGQTNNIFMNSGDMMDCKALNDKFNYYNPGKEIDFHLVNFDPKMYVNLGQVVSASEVNDTINNKP